MRGKNFKCKLCHRSDYSLRCICPGCKGVDSYVELLPCVDPKPLNNSTMSDKPEKIEWKKLQASNGDSYYGYFNGLQVAYIMDVGLPDEYILNFGDNSKPEYFNAVGLAKGRGGEMLEEWLIRADLAKPSECDCCRKENNAELYHVCPDCFKNDHQQEAKPSEWISVETELPEHNKTVLICSDEHTTTGYYNRGLEQWWFDGGCIMQGDVTHWQPLPPPPAETP